MDTNREHNNRYRDEINGWNEYRKYVVEELKRLNKAYETLDRDMNDRLDKLDIDVLTLKLKAGMWGAVAGTIFSSLLQLIPFLINRVVGK